MEVYENSLRIARDSMAAMAYAERTAAEKAKAEGIKVGRAKGRAEGKAEGRTEGIALGFEKAKREEHEKLLNMAHAMLMSGMSEEQVKKITGLTDAEMAKMRS